VIVSGGTTAGVTVTDALAHFVRSATPVQQSPDGIFRMYFWAWGVPDP